MKHKIKVFIAVILLLPGALLEAQPLDFAQALSRMLEKNQKLAASRSIINQRTEEQKAARALYYPQLDISAQWTHLNDPLEMDTSSLSTMTGELISTLHPSLQPGQIEAITSRIPDSIRLQDQNFSKSDLTASWPIYTGGKITSANRAADSRIEIAKTENISITERMFCELVRLYYGVQLTCAVAQVRDEVRQAMKAHLRQAELLEQTGMISKAERLHAQVAAEEADREHKKSVRDMEIASTALCGLIFCEPSAITPVSPLFWTHELPEKEAFLENAHKDNIILKNLKQQMKLADAGLQNEKSAYRPDVYLFASKALLTNDLTILDPEWAAGIGARFTLFDGFARSGKVASARAVKTQVNQLYTQMLRDVDTLVVSRYQTLIQSLEQIDALDVSISFAREHLRARTRGFEEGMATSLDVVDAELAFSKVKIDRLEALYSFDLALSKLLEASGDISSFNKYRIKGEKETNHL